MAQTRTIHLKDFARELRRLTEEDLPELKRAAMSAVAESVPDLVRSSPVDTGLYAASWGFTQTEESVILGNYAPYASIIEYGARPFTPPLTPLLQWAKRVLQDPSQPPNYSPAVHGLARYTQKKIAEHGIAPRHVMENEIPNIIERIRQEVERRGLT